jgi:drug/metabolite transporter (DMT)-like permease
MTASPTHRSQLPGILMAAAGAIAFSGKAIIVKLAYRYDVDAVTVIMYRMLFALPLFLLLAYWSSRGKPPLRARDWRVMIGLGFSGYYLSSFLDFLGLQYVTASLERLILYLNPTLVLVLGVFLFKAHVSKRQWIALGFSYLGVLVVFGHDMTLSGSDVILGAALVFGSAISYAVYLAFSGQTVKRFGAQRLTGFATSIACVLCIAQFFILRPASAMVVAPEVIWLSILNATLCTFCPVLLVMMAIERIGAGVTAQIGMIGPLSTITMGILLLDEPFTLWVAAGTVLVLLGIWLLTRKPQSAA